MKAFFVKVYVVSKLSRQNTKLFYSFVYRLMAAHYHLVIQGVPFVGQDKITWVVIPFVSKHFFVGVQKLNQQVPRDSQIGPLSAWIAPVSPHNESSPYTHANLVAQARSFKFVGEPLRAEWRWFIYLAVHAIQWNKATLSRSCIVLTVQPFNLQKIRIHMGLKNFNKKILPLWEKLAYQRDGELFLERFSHWNQRWNGWHFPYYSTWGTVRPITSACR